MAKSKRIKIVGEFQKDNGKKFTEKEAQDFTDKFFELIDNSEISFIGMLK